MSVFGHSLRVATFGESHGSGVGCVLEGIPPGLKLTAADVQNHLTRRRPGQSSLTTQRQEADVVKILSGTENGFTMGTPIAMLVENADQRTIDYASTQEIPRPGHADYTYKLKYSGFVASSGGGRASARETIGRVAAGSVALKWLYEAYGTSIVAWVSTVGPVDIPEDVTREMEFNPPSRDEVDKEGRVADPTDSSKLVETRCPHRPTAELVAAHIVATQQLGDTAGGITTCVITNVPVGIGEPCFDKIEAELAKAMLSLPATKGFEIGSGFKGVRLRGSQHNDRFTILSGSTSESVPLLKSHTNNAGGTLGGITSGNNIVFRVAFKPVSSIGIDQSTFSYSGDRSVLKVRGRHDPCVLPRTPPLVECMAALVVGDLTLRQRARLGPIPLPVAIDADKKA